MPIEVSPLLLTSSATDGTSYSPGSLGAGVIPGAHVVVLWGTEMTTVGENPPDQTWSGAGLTWIAGPSVRQTNRRLGFAYALVPPTGASGAITGTNVDNGSGTTAIGFGAHVFCITLLDRDDPVKLARSLAQAAATSITIPAPTLALDRGVRPMYWITHRANEAHTPRGGWSELGDTPHAAPVEGYSSGWRNDGVADDAGASWTTSVASLGLLLSLQPAMVRRPIMRRG